MDEKTESQKTRDRIDKANAIARYRSMNEPCHWCGHTGGIIAYSKAEPSAPYSFRCNYCSAAEIIGSSLPAWTEKLSEKFHAITHANWARDFSMLEAMRKAK